MFLEVDHYFAEKINFSDEVHFGLKQNFSISGLGNPHNIHEKMNSSEENYSISGIWDCGNIGATFLRT